VKVVEGPRSIAADRWILRLNRPDSGVLAAAARPGSEAFWSIAAPLHWALRQQQPVLNFTSADRDLLAVWIEAYRIVDVIVHHADPYHPAVLDELEELLTRAGARLWLVVEAATHALVVQELAGLQRVETITWSEFEAFWTPFACVESPEPSGARSRLDPAPAWSTQHARLERAAKRHMDLPYIEGFCEGASWTRDERPSKAAIARRLRTALTRFDDPECLVSAARGFAVALHELGWQVTLDLERLARHASGTPLRKPGDVVRLGDVRRFRDPQVAALTGLAALELARDEILGLQLADVASEGDEINLWHDKLTVPEVLRPVIRAQRLRRLRAGALESEPLFMDGRRPLSARRFATLAIAGLEELESALPRVPLHERPAADERWLLERGIAISWIARADRRSIGPAGVPGEDLLLRVVGELARPYEIRRPEACVCAVPHDHPVAPSSGTWPSRNNHARPAADHPWKTSAYERRLR
jgi:hypothetical protein